MGCVIAREIEKWAQLIFPIILAFHIIHGPCSLLGHFFRSGYFRQQKQLLQQIAIFLEIILSDVSNVRICRCHWKF